MRAKKLLSLFIGIFILTIIFSIETKSQETNFIGKTIEFESLDDLKITADLYLTDDMDAPFILLFHQARWSRGSYREIAPKLNALGFNCMAIDQRSGKGVNDIENETAKRAKEKGIAMSYTDAYPDLQGALNFVQKEYKPKVFLIWGSSYSAALSFILADKNMEQLDGMLAFSPGEYFTFEDKSIPEYAKNLHMPVFVTSASYEEGNWKGIYEVIPSKYKMNYLPTRKGYHGSSALWEVHEGHEKYWEQVVEFLNLFLE